MMAKPKMITSFVSVVVLLITLTTVETRPHTRQIDTIEHQFAESYSEQVLIDGNADSAYDYDENDGIGNESNHFRIVTDDQDIEDENIDDDLEVSSEATAYDYDENDGIGNGTSSVLIVTDGQDITTGSTDDDLEVLSEASTGTTEPNVTSPQTHKAKLRRNRRRQIIGLSVTAVLAVLILIQIIAVCWTKRSERLHDEEIRRQNRHQRPKTSKKPKATLSRDTVSLPSGHLGSVGSSPSSSPNTPPSTPPQPTTITVTPEPLPNLTPTMTTLTPPTTVTTPSATITTNIVDTNLTNQIG